LSAKKSPAAPAPGEGDVNRTSQRAAWQARAIDPTTRALLDRDAAAFHGAGFGAASVGGESLFRSGPAGPLLSGAEHVAPFACYRCAYGYRTGPDGKPPLETCALACERDGVVPGILVVGKALGGGVLPIAATICREGLDVAGDYAFGHYTHEKNPVTAAAALETLAVIDDEDLVANAARVGARALERMTGWRSRFPVVGDVRGRGLLPGADLVCDRESREPAPDAAERVLYGALDRGLSFKTSMGNVLTLTPPLVTTEADMDRALAIREECLASEGG